MEFRIMNLVLCGTVLATASGVATATEFLFDDGTSQGWNVEILNGGTSVIGPGVAGFNDTNNFPNAIGADPVDGDGSAFTPGGAPNGTDFRVVQFQSPDLSADTMWQNLESFTGQLLPSFTDPFGDFFANALLVIDDTTGGGSSERTFFNGTADLISVGNWNEETFSGIGGLLTSFGVASYTTKQVVFQLFYDNPLDVEVFFSLDNVTPTAAQAPAPATLVLLGLGLAGMGYRRHKRNRSA